MNGTDQPAAVIARMPVPTGTKQSDALETELAEAFGARNAVAVSSGTGALHTALAAAGIGAGDEVLVARHGSRRRRKDRSADPTP